MTNQALAFGQLPFGMDDVIDHFGTWTIHKGRAYFQKGAVLEITPDLDGQQLVGLVQGTQRYPYRVEVTWDSSDAPVLECKCSCPVGFDCKHAAALLLAAVAHPGPRRIPSTSVVAGAGLAHTEALDKSASPTSGAHGALPEAVESWFTSAAARLTSSTEAPDREDPTPEHILYIWKVAQSNKLWIALRRANMLKDGRWGIERDYEFPQLESSKARFVRPIDSSIARLSKAGSESFQWTNGKPPDDPDVLDMVLRRMIETGRAFFEDKDRPPLKLGPPKESRIIWLLHPDGMQQAGIVPPDEHSIPLHASSPWYVDTTTWQAGPITLDVPAALAALLLEAPPVAPKHAKAFAARLDKLAGRIYLPLPRTDIVEETRLAPVVPTLQLTAQDIWSYSSAALNPSRATKRNYEPEKAPRAVLEFDYGSFLFDYQTNEHRLIEDHKVIVTRRDLKAEEEALRKLIALGMLRLQSTDPSDARVRFAFPNDAPSAWLRFLENGVPDLQSHGWRVGFDKSFPYRLVKPDDDVWHCELTTEEGGYWFSAALGITINGRKVPLLPLILAAFRMLDERPTTAAIERLNIDGKFLAPLADGRVLVLPFERMRVVLEILVELFDLENLPKNGRLSVSLPAAAQLAGIAREQPRLWIHRCPERLARLVAICHGTTARPELILPDSFRAVLRDYQREGVMWLQFLREFGLGGILADDMGLGKTIQTLAHLSIEKDRGRLNSPALIVCPTSVVPNWLAEAQRFAPSLKFVSLHGADRQARFGAVRGADVAITTYALLQRDAEMLTAFPWSGVILDEAQAIKNARTKTAEVACGLQADYRVCLTGTPVENHLGELWSQFNFLMPGTLDSEDTFARTFRKPIEEFNDETARRALAARLSAFLLRRTKSQVARELPEKTEMLRQIELEGDQRDLYETVRLAMHERVRQEIAARGLKRSQLVILDALLKLRQICCDPRLLKLPAAANVRTSAKLDLLMEMLDELTEEGRRVLLFSQFTSMLDLIAPELDRANIPYVEIRGDTTDRATPVNRFQNREVPLFLLSLKAGGTGLNLTAADTVIHYDPWWNPAVEDQATGRAHRIGQDKPVFVYKLITLGTIEEKMLELQQRKRHIAEAIYHPEKAASIEFDEDNLELLFAPLDKATGQRIIQARRT